MSFPRYSNYKDSGVEWLGEVPEHWAIRKVRWLCEIKKRISGELGHDVLSITQQGIRVKDLESNDGQISMDYSKYQFVEVGDFAMNHMDLLTGYVDVSDVHGVTSPDYRVFTIRDLAISHEKYFLYLFQMGYKNKIFYAYGQGSSQLGRWRLPTEQFNDLPFPLPPKSEQTKITAFLDHETVKIDELVTEQRRLMELLKEKRQAIISHAVTKGLNSHSPMKPSGNLWLGDVPAHWDVKRLKHVKANEKNAFVDGPFGSNLKSEHFVDNGDVYVIESNFATQGRIYTENLKTISNEHFATINRSETRGGDIIIAKIGAQYGKASILPALDKLAVVSGNSLKLTINQKSYDVKFVNWHLANLKELGAMQDIVNATAQPALSLGEMNNLPMLVPPLSEQEAIVMFLDKKLIEFDTLTDEAQRAIDLLQERRTALISAAVTGKIDIRNMYAKEVA